MLRQGGAMSPRFAARCIVPLLASCLSFAAPAFAAPAPALGPNVWSMQLDGGLYAPIEGSGASPTAGVRYCKHFSPHLQGGMFSAWSFKRAKLEAPTGDQGTDSQVELARVDANLVPLMGFLQVDLTDRFLVPFFGFGVGYEWLMLHSFDHRTGAQEKARYANLAWQTFAGVGLQLTTIWRVNGELYYNGGSLEREVRLPDGTVQREAVDVNGVGLRVGLDMKFD